MSFDEIIKFTYDWVTVFGGFLEMLMSPLSDIARSFGVNLPDAISNLTLFGLLFSGGFLFIVAYTLVKWTIGIVG